MMLEFTFGCEDILINLPATTTTLNSALSIKKGQNDPKFRFSPFGAKAVLALCESHFGIGELDWHPRSHFRYGGKPNWPYPLP
jgi:hypothetical protein